MPWPDKGANYAIAGGAGDVLDRARDVGEVVARLRRRDARVHGALRRIDETPHFWRDLAHDEGARRVAVPAIDDRARVDRHDLPVAQTALSGHAVNDLLVDRHAQRVAEWGDAAGDADERGGGAFVADHLFRNRIELERGDARPDFGGHAVKDARNKSPRDGHLVDLGAALDCHAAIGRHLSSTPSAPVGRLRAATPRSLRRSRARRPR